MTILKLIKQLIYFTVCSCLVKKRARKPWITQEMFSKLDEGRKWKNVNTEESGRNYRRLKNQLKTATEKAKKEYLENACTEIM